MEEKNSRDKKNLERLLSENFQMFAETIECGSSCEQINDGAQGEFIQVGSALGILTYYLVSVPWIEVFKRESARFMVHSIFCDHLNALSDNQLPADTHSAWKFVALPCMHAHINSSEAADCHLSFKWSQEFCGPALSRKPL